MRQPTNVGTILAGRYRVDRKLGEGAAGVVWLVGDLRKQGLTWAIKELDFSSVPLDEREDARKLFARETETLQRLSHAALPKIVDRFQLEDCEYLVMERVEGPTLEQRFREEKKPFPEPDVARWGAQICEVLQYLHEQDPPVVYRDLKPSNVMLTRHDTIMLVDFGIARAINPEKVGDTTCYGTPGYAPPEQYMGQTVPQSDLYSLGATLYQMLTRHEPKPFAFEFAPTASRNPDVSPRMARLIDRLLAVKVEDRPASAREAREEFSELIGYSRSFLSKAVSRLGHWVARSRGVDE